MQPEAPSAGAPSTRPAAPATTITLAELIDEYMAEYAGRDRTRAHTLDFWRTRLGKRAFARISDDDVYAGLQELRTRPARRYAGLDADGKRIERALGKRSNATVNRYHAALMALLTWAIKTRRAPRGWDNPARRVERLREKKGVERFLSDPERERLLAAARASTWPRLYLLTLMALTTAARRGELLALTWADVDLERGLAHVRSSKNDQPRALPLVPAVAAELARFRIARPEARVFPGRSRLTEARHFGSSWRAALDRAGIKNCRFHDLRHSCASYLAQSGASLLEIADVMGHKHLAMVKRYAHLTTTSKASLVNRILGGIK